MDTTTIDEAAQAASLHYLERIRAIEYARLELERRLERAQEQHLEMVTTSAERLQALGVELQRAQSQVAALESEKAKAVALAEKRAAEALRRQLEAGQQAEGHLRQRLSLFEAEIAFASSTIRDTRAQLDELRTRMTAVRSEHTAAVEAHAAQKAELELLLAERERLNREHDDELRQVREVAEAERTRLAAEHEARLEALRGDAATERAAWAAQFERQEAEASAERAAWAGRFERLEADASAARAAWAARFERQEAEASAERAAWAARFERLEADASAARAAWAAQFERQEAEAAAALARVTSRLEEVLLDVGTLREALRRAEEQHASAEARHARAVEERDERQRALVDLGADLAQRDGELAEARETALQLEATLQQLEDSTRYRAGVAVVEAGRSWRGFMRLPVRLWRLGRDARSRRREALLPAPTSVPSHDEQQDALAAVLALAQSDGLAAAERFLETRTLEPYMRAHALTALAKAVATTTPTDAVRLGEQAQLLDPRDYRAKWLAFLRFDVGQVRAAAEALQAQSPRDMSASERARFQQVVGQARLLASPPTIPPRAVPACEPVAGRVLYVAASVRPYHQSGYTLRTHALLGALVRTGLDVTCVARPGYPGDRGDALPSDVGTAWELDGVRYRTLPSPDRRRCAADEYLQQAADALVELAGELRPALIHAGSNYETALPALIAARRLGLPFVYEVRGLWEYTAASKMPDWERSERFALEKSLETLVATEADRVLALNGALADELAARGVDRARIALAPNAIDPARHRPHERDAALAARLGLPAGAFVVGYAGSLVGYEGLEELVTAIARSTSAKPVHALIVGDGETRSTLEALAQRLGVAPRIVFAGRVAADAVPAHLALCDAVALPRRPFAVCELVTPIKPLEAMAMGLPVIASSVAPLRELVEHGVTGLLHAAGDADSLAEAIDLLAGDADLASRLAEEARERVLSGATWQCVAARVASEYAELAAGLAPRTASGPEPLSVPASRNTLDADEKRMLDERFAEAFSFGGADAVRDLLSGQTEGHSARFFAFCALRAATACQHAGDVDAARVFIERAVDASADATTMKAAAALHHHAGDDARALSMIDRLEAAGSMDASVERIAAPIRARLRVAALAAEPAAPAAFDPVPRSCVNFLHFSLPYTSVGYSTRSHGIALGVQAAGWDIRPCTRPGFPHDFRPELEGADLPERDVVDGITYRRLLEGGRKGQGEAEYLLAAADACERVLREERPALVHAASNYTTALPALIAARRLGIPFVYEVRGFWEITRSSRDGDFEKSNKYRAMQLLESLVLDNADHVITITSAMREDLEARGVPADRISLAYNSVDPARFEPIAPDTALADRLGLPEGVPVIGYVGSFVDYEGLDDLVRAAAILRDDGVAFRLLMVGDGAAMPQLRAMIDEAALGDVAILTGRVPHEEVEAYYSLIDIAPFPRKPWQVCELVSPLKPFEAMAMEKAVVVSGTRALLEIVEPGRNGLVFEKGDPTALAAVLRRLVAEPDLRRTLGRQAREWVCEFRSWNRAGRDIVAAYDQVLAAGPRRTSEAGVPR